MITWVTMGIIPTTESVIFTYKASDDNLQHSSL